MTPAPGYEALDDAVEAWAEQACPHPRLRLVDGQVVAGPLRRALADHDGQTLFAATDLTQRTAGNRWMFRDLGTGVEICHDSPIMRYDNASGTLPQRLRTEVRPMDIDVYLNGVAHLRALFSAAVQTGNSVRWY